MDRAAKHWPHEPKERKRERRIHRQLELTVLDVPSRRNVDRHDRRPALLECCEDVVERSADAALEAKAKDAVEHEVELCVESVAGAANDLTVSVYGQRGRRLVLPLLEQEKATRESGVTNAHCGHAVDERNPKLLTLRHESLVDRRWRVRRVSSQDQRTPLLYSTGQDARTHCKERPCASFWVQNRRCVAKVLEMARGHECVTTSVTHTVPHAMV